VTEPADNHGCLYIALIAFGVYLAAVAVAVILIG